MKTVLYHEDYTGPRFRYGMTLRPLLNSAMPTDFIIGSQLPHPEHRHGTIDYPRPLTEHEVRQHSLVAVKLTDGEPS